MLLQRVPMLSWGYSSWRTRCLTSDYSCLPSPSVRQLLSKWVSKTCSSWFVQVWRSLLGTNDKDLIARTLQAIMMSWVSFGSVCSSYLSVKQEIPLWFFVIFPLHLILSLLKACEILTGRWEDSHCWNWPHLQIFQERKVFLGLFGSAYT